MFFDRLPLRIPRHRWPAVTVCALAALTASSCAKYVDKEIPGNGTDGGGPAEACRLLPLFVDKDVDLLFVVDNSGSMEQEQKNLRAAFPKLIEALRTPKLGMQAGTSKPCNATNSSGCKIPNVHIGVVSTDLGAGTYNLPSCETVGGDAGRLQAKAKVAGCTPPSNPWISYNEGVTNVPGSSKDGIELVKDAFACIAELGILGCGYEQTIEASRRALDPGLNTNSGFLRNDPKNNKDAILAVLYLTDEDDCSASNQQLFDPSAQGLSDPLGPLTSYRCFEFGVTCDCGGGSASCTRTKTGLRNNCVPGGSKPYLRSVDDYISFFKSIKKYADGRPNPRRVVMAGIAGPTEPVDVRMQGSNPELGASCTGTGGMALPAIRIKTLVHAFAKELTKTEQEKAKQQNVAMFTDTKSGKVYDENFTSICSSDFSPALQRFGQHIVGTLGSMCLRPPALTDNGGILCQKDDVICDQATCGTVVKCQTGCLDLANFTIEEVTSAGRTKVDKCPSNLFDAKIAASACGSSCPCWRLVPDAACKNTAGSSPYAVQVMRLGEAAKGSYASVCDGATATHLWNTREFAELAQCN